MPLTPSETATHAWGNKLLDDNARLQSELTEAHLRTARAQQCTAKAQNHVTSMEAALHRMLMSPAAGRRMIALKKAHTESYQTYVDLGDQSSSPDTLDNFRPVLFYDTSLSQRLPYQPQPLVLRTLPHPTATAPTATAPAADLPPTVSAPERAFLRPNGPPPTPPASRRRGRKRKGLISLG